MEAPETRYVRVGDDRVAYQVLGEGPDIIYFSGMLSHVDIRWEDPSFAGFLRRIASFSRFISFDRRGSGVSDSLPAGRSPTWEEWVDDVRAVLDDVGSERACVFAVNDGGPTGILFAASHPDRTSAMVLANATARYVAADDYPEGLPREAADATLRVIEEQWGTEGFGRLAVPSRRDDPVFLRWYAKFQRAGIRPREAASYLRAIMNLDARHALPAIRVPTLVLHTSGNPVIPIAQGRRMAAGIAGARFMELPGTDLSVWTEHMGLVTDAVEEVVTGIRRGPEPDRVLATVLFSDIVDSTQRAATLGDRRWRELLGAHEDVARGAVAAFRGRLVKMTGDGLLATFDGPTRAIHCAAEIRARMKGLGLQVRLGLHTGEVELLEDDVGGIGVHIAARVMAEAASQEIVATGTVKDLVVGSEIEFSDRGVRTLKGVPGEWRLFQALV